MKIKIEQYKKDAIWFLIKETSKFTFIIGLIFMFALGVFNYIHNCEPPERWVTNEYEGCIKSLDMTKIIISALAPSAIFGYIIITWKKIKRMLKEQGFE